MRRSQALPIFVAWGALVGLVVGLGQSCNDGPSASSVKTASATATATTTSKTDTRGSTGTSTATESAACNDQGRLFQAGNVPSLDGCNSCSCSCDTPAGGKAECFVACTEMACELQAKMPQVGQGKVFDAAGHEQTYQGVACAEPQLCEPDAAYVEACERHGGLALDNGCCDYTCTVKVVREEPLVAGEAETCRAATAKFGELLSELTTVIEGDTASSRRHPCQDSTDCKLVPAEPAKACGGGLAVGAQAFKEVEAALAIQTAEIERTCPRFVGACEKATANVQAACVGAYCGTEVSPADIGDDDEDEQ